MTEGLLIEIMQLTVKTAAFMTAPLIVTIMIVGLLSQILQTVTQIKDQSLTFVPKVFIGGIVFTFAIPWYIQLARRYVDIIFTILEKGRM